MQFDFNITVPTSHKIEIVGFSLSSNPFFFILGKFAGAYLVTLWMESFIYIYSSYSFLQLANSLNMLVLSISGPKQTAETRKDDLSTKGTRTSQKSNADDFVLFNGNDMLDCLSSFYGEVS